MKSIRLVLILIILVSFLGFSVFGRQNKAYAGYESDWVNLWVGQITPGAGTIGVDITWPNYNPCHHSNDAYYDACELSNNGAASYYKVHNYNTSSNDFPYGVFID